MGLEGSKSTLHSCWLTVGPKEGLARPLMPIPYPYTSLHSANQPLHFPRTFVATFWLAQESLVQLTDDAMREMYLNLMLIYMGDYNDEQECEVRETAVGEALSWPGFLARPPR